ncbi:MAG: hypothetical protein IPJ62_21010 [Betaproteobacteria bacterium]|nr:hypothetical protein [Betaproteobacteria bacterium]
MSNKSGWLALSLVSLTAFAQSPVDTDGDKYKVVMENEQVRVLEYRDLPGEKTHQHRHPAFVLYAVGTVQAQDPSARRQGVDARVQGG